MATIFIATELALVDMHCIVHAAANLTLHVTPLLLAALCAISWQHWQNSTQTLHAKNLVPWQKLGQVTPSNLNLLSEFRPTIDKQDFGAKAETQAGNSQ